MRSKQVLCVDLGSAYTKVALREDWNGTAELIRDLPQADSETTFCIPSLLAKVRRGGKVHWLSGADAATQRNSDDVKLVTNWKEVFFSQMPNAEVDAFEAASEFFRQLPSILAQGSRGIDAKKYPVRVCIPKLEEVTDGEDRISEVLEHVGWKSAPDCPTVYEPEANALGVFSRGKNATWEPSRGTGRSSPGRSFMLAKMFEDEVFRKYERIHGSFSTLAIDIGAYTTDFGLVRFDTSFSEKWTIPEVLQESVKLGIGELDQAVQMLLSRSARETVQRSNAREWDSRKQLLYSGNEAALLDDLGKQVIVGRGTERQQIDGAIETFAARVIAAGKKFLAGKGERRIDFLTITGGGAMIPALRSAVFSSFPATSRRIDLLDRHEAARSTPVVNGRRDQRAVDARARLNRDLMRGGSAVGGTSVFFR